MASETDVIIIGAGAAGLSAAKQLNSLDLSYTVIEGSHRIGGRAYSEKIAPGVWFDLGCAYLEGAETTFVAIADELGIAVGKDKGNPFEDARVRYHRNGKTLNDDQRAACLRYLGDSHKAIAAASEQGRDVAVSDIIDLDNEYAAPLMAAIASGWTHDVDQVSCADAADSKGGAGYPVLNGYGNLVAAWGADVAVSLNTRAERIDWTGSGVAVETPKGTVTGRTALITVSTGILGAGDIVFAPGLPDWKTDAIHNVPNGTANKMCIYFDTDVFGPDGRGCHGTWNDEDAGNGARMDANVMGHNYAVVFVGGPYAVWLEKKGQQACRDFAIDSIADVFGHHIRKHVSRSIVTAWATEPWTRGSYACARPGQAHQRANLARPIDERLFFAGEATINGAQGTCHGAYQSGIRAANEIAGML